jgi:hypothetical protein
MWSPIDTKSPNRLDALVWLMTMLKDAGAPSEEQMRAYANAEEVRKSQQITPGMQVLPGTIPPALDKPKEPNPDLDDIEAYLRIGMKGK